MKAIRQRFHRQIVKQYKQNYFSTVRKELLELQEFQVHYMKILDNDQQLLQLLETFGVSVFCKHITTIIDERLYHKLYHQDEIYFLRNLDFVCYLLQFEVLPFQHLPVLICNLAQVITQHQQLSAQNTAYIFEILQKIFTNQKYLSHSLESISKKHLLPKLYDLIIKKEIKEYFFRLINFCKLIANDKITLLNDTQKLHCLQIHILTSNNIEELYVSYSFLGETFEKIHSEDQELYDYASILDKTMRNISITRLIDPISFFLMKALNNHSLNKLAVEMGYAQTVLDVILNHLMVKNNVSIFGHHSIWCIFKKILANLEKTHQTKLVDDLSLENLKEKLHDYQAMKYPYVKMEVEETMNELENFNLQNSFTLSCSYENISQQLQDVQI